MLTLDQMIKILNTQNLNNVSLATGINYQQIARIKRGADANPTYKTFKKLSDYLEINHVNSQ